MKVLKKIKQEETSEEILTSSINKWSGCCSNKIVNTTYNTGVLGIFC